MTVQWLGHAGFRITHEGYSIVIDPYNSDYINGYPKLCVKADRKRPALCRSLLSRRHAHE